MKSRRKSVLNLLPTMIFLIMTFRFGGSGGSFPIVIRNIDTEIISTTKNSVVFKAPFEHLPECKLKGVSKHVKARSKGFFEIHDLNLEKNGLLISVTCTSSLKRSIFSFQL